MKPEPLIGGKSPFIDYGVQEKFVAHKKSICTAWPQQFARKNFMACGAERPRFGGTRTQANDFESNNMMQSASNVYIDGSDTGQIKLQGCFGQNPIMQTKIPKLANILNLQSQELAMKTSPRRQLV